MSDCSELKKLIGVKAINEDIVTRDIATPSHL